MTVTNRLRIGFAVIAFFAFLLGYMGFVGVMHVRHSFMITKTLTSILYHVSISTRGEMLYIMSGDRGYEKEVENANMNLLKYVEKAENELKNGDNIMEMLALIRNGLSPNIEDIFQSVRLFVKVVSDLNANIERLRSDKLSIELSKRSTALAKILFQKGYVREAMEIKYLEKSILSGYDLDMIKDIEKMLSEVMLSVNDPLLRTKIKDYLDLVNNISPLVSGVVNGIAKYNDISNKLYRNIWSEIGEQKDYIDRAILYTMFTTTIIFLFLVFLLGVIGYTLTRLLSRYFNITIRTLDRVRRGDFSKKLVYSAKDGEFGIMAKEYNQIMEMLNENVGYIIDISKEVLGSTLVKMSVSQAIEGNPLTMARRVVESLVELNRYKSVIENDYTKDEIYNHLWIVLNERFNVSRVIILELNESKNRLEPVLKKGLGDVPIDVVVNPNICRAKRTARVVSALDFRRICAYSVEEEDLFSVCIPIMMGGEVKGIVKIVEEKKNRDRLYRDLPFIIKYVETTAPVVYAAKLLEITREQSLKDSLTGLYNRRFLDSYLEKYLSFADRKGFVVGFIMIDIDNFKKVNDTYGHKNGDVVLKEVAHAIVSSVRASDVVIRYGGEEFLVILPDVAEGKTAQVAEKIRRAVEMTSIQIEGKVLHVTISCGVAEYPRHSRDPYQVIKFADIALYRAKKTGKNRVVVFDEKEMGDLLAEASGGATPDENMDSNPRS